jgi:thymidine phosphorylase
VIEAPVGQAVHKGDVLVIVHAATHELADRVIPRLRSAWRLSDAEVRRPPHVLARVDANGVTKGG